MYNFRKLTGKYSITISTIAPDGSISKYSAIIELIASYLSESNCYIFELLSRKDVKLNDASPIQLADVFMLRLSDTYYPMTFKVSASGKILRIINFDKIKKCWQMETAKIMEETPCIAYEQYIECASSNLESEDTFLQAMLKDSFIQFYFIEDVNNIKLTCYNFPHNGESTIYKLQNKNDCTIQQLSNTFHSMNNEDETSSGKVSYELSQQLDIISVNSEFTCSASDGIYRKYINIQVENRMIKNKNSILSFLLD